MDLSEMDNFFRIKLQMHYGFDYILQI